MPVIYGGARSALGGSGGIVLPTSVGANPGVDPRRSLTPGPTLLAPVSGFANAGGPYYDLVRSDTPDGYWRAGETGSIFALNSAPVANPTTGLYSGGYTLQQASLLVSEADYATLFDGSTAFIDVGGDGSGYGNGPYSFEGWFKTTATGANLCAFSFDAISGVAGNIGAGLGYNANGRFTVVDGTNRIVSSAAATYADGVAHHYAVTKVVAANLWKLYIDGQDVTTADSLPATATTSGAFTRNRIGCDNNSGTQRFFFNGTLDEIAIYNYALTPAQVLAHYNAGAGIAAALNFPIIGGGYYGQAA